MLRDQLEIILITYNRKEALERTFRQLLAPSSPVRDVDITVLDNHSTDGTAELIRRYAERYRNIKHIRHPRNIGSNANIARLFEIASKKYVWPLCDDDDYHFEHFREAEELLAQNPDVLIVNHEYTEGKTDFPYWFRLITFLPAGIYKTSCLTDEVLFNVYNNIFTWFPHLAVSAALINKNGVVLHTSDNIVTAGKNDFVRIDWEKDLRHIDSKTLPVINKLMPNRSRRTNAHTVELGYMEICELITDPGKREAAVNTFIYGKSFYEACKVYIQNNRVANDGYWGNLLIPWTTFTRRQKFVFIVAFFDSLRSYLRHYRFFSRQKKELKQAVAVFRKRYESSGR